MNEWERAWSYGPPDDGDWRWRVPVIWGLMWLWLRLAVLVVVVYVIRD